MPNTSISFPASPTVNQQYTYGSTTYVYTGINWAVYISSASLPPFVTSANIVDGTIVNADINASAAIDGSKISPVFTNASTFSSTLGVTGAATLASVGVTGAATVGTTLGVTGAATIQGLTVGKGGGSLTPNTAVGTSALGSNTTGAQNSAFGYGALANNTTGAFNTVCGQGGLQTNSIGSANNAFGFEALKTNKANDNNAFGYKALTANTTGTLNCAFGHQALTTNTTGSYNSAVGYAALLANTTGNYNNAFGYQALTANTTGTLNCAFGHQAGTSITTGSNNTCIGYNAQAPSAAISNTVTLGDSSVNNLRCQDTTISAVSDRRDKTDIIDIPTGLEFITAVRPVSFVWNMRNGGIVGVQAFGFIAQELLEAQTTVGITVPKLVTTTNPDKYEVAPAALLPVMVKAIQELKAELEATKLRITQLENIP